MDKKLTILFAFFKHIDVLTSYISMTMDRSYIEDWDERMDAFYAGNKTKSIKLPLFIIRIIEELIEYYYEKIDEYNNLDWDDYWYLNIYFDTKKRELRFTSQNRLQKDYEFEINTTIDDFGSEKIKEITNDGQTIVDFKFTGAWDDGDIYDVYHNDSQIIDQEYKKNEQTYWDITNEILSKDFGKWWNSEAGIYGEIRIWGDDIFVQGNERILEWVDTDLNLKIKI